MNKKVGSLFAKYVSLNIFGMLGISLYILADTFFISKAAGAIGVAALNLVLPIYSLIFAIGAMIGVGFATCFSIEKSKCAGIQDRLDKEKSKALAERYFSSAVLWAVAIGAIFMVAGGLFPKQIITLVGGDEKILEVGVPYTRIFMLFTPAFMLNSIFNAFVRNDKAPSVAMIATLSSSLFNIVMDYILMFPLGMGMTGAALATAISPILGVLICSLHFFSEDNTICFRLMKLDIKLLLHSCGLGVSAFVGEISSGVTTAVFNMLILGLTGNIGVAAYGIIANTAIVAIAIFNGIAQGAQPLLSDFYGRGDKKSYSKVFRLSIVTAVVSAIVIIGLMYWKTDIVVGIFNSENNTVMGQLALTGLRLYFIGFLFAGFNIVATGYLSATENAKGAFVASITRGFIAIILCAVVMSRLFGMNGVWLAFPTAEFITMVVAICVIKR